MLLVVKEDLAAVKMEYERDKQLVSQLIYLDTV